MAKIELKGFFEDVKPEKLVGKNGDLRMQNVIFRTPGYHNEFDGISNPDEYWSLDVMGSNIDRLNLKNTTNPKGKAKLVVYINSKTWYKETDIAKADPQYSLYAILYGCEHLL